MSFRLPNIPEHEGGAPESAATDELQSGSPSTARFTSQSLDVASPDAEADLRANGRMRSFGMLGIVLAVAAGILFGMRHLGMSGVLDMPDITIDYQLDKNGRSTVLADHQRVIEDLSTTKDVQQIPLNDLQMNPFTWKGLATAVAPRTEVVDPEAVRAAEERRRLEERKKNINLAYSRLRLNSVLGSGDASVARISGELVRPGDRIGEFFIVQAIDGRSVQLMADGQVYRLAIGE